MARTPKTRHAPGRTAAPDPVSGPSYPVAVRVLATALLAALLAAALPALPELVRQGIGWTAAAMAALVAVVILAGWVAIVFGRTTVDAQVLQQRGLRTRVVQRSAIQQAKLVHIPGLQWIVVPRLVVRTGAFGMATFTAGNAEVLAAFQDLMAERLPKGPGQGS